MRRRPGARSGCRRCRRGSTAALLGRATAHAPARGRRRSAQETSHDPGASPAAEPKPSHCRQRHGIRHHRRDGRDYIDASGGAAVSCLGHSHPDVLAAMHAQIDKLAYAHTSFFTTRGRRGTGRRPGRARARGHRATSTSSRGGSEAIEAALKMARQYFVEIGQPQRRHFIARRQSYHGNTLGALAVGGNDWRRAAFAPLLIEVAPRLALLRIPRPARRRDARAIWRAAGRRAGGQDRRSSAPRRHRLRRRDRRRRHAGAIRRRPATSAHARDLRPARHPADPRRGDVRHGPHRHAARLRAGGRRARPDGHRQGAGRRLRADRRACSSRADRSRPSQRARACSSTATPISATRSPAPRRSPCSR